LWWQQIAEHRYLWVQRWPSMVYLTTLGWIVLYAACRPRVRDEVTVRIERFGFGGLALLGVAIVASLARSPLLVAVQLPRALYTTLIVTLIFIARRLTEDLEARRLPWPIYVVTALLPMTQSLVVPFAGIAVALIWARLPRRLPSWLAWSISAALLITLPMRFRAHNPPPPSPDWLALQSWARTATPVDAVFVAPLHQPDFRVYSERASVLGVQDSQPAIFNRAYAEEWLSRATIIDDFARQDCGALTRDGAHFGAAFIVTEWNCTGEAPIHTVGRFRVYRNPP
jgi:hypothetical protein